MTIKIPYGLRNERLVHISEVKSGLHQDIKCICNNCDSLLVAKKGEIMQHHFAHHTTECNSQDSTLESLLHLMVKEVLEEEKILKLPTKKSLSVLLEDKMDFCHLDSVCIEKRYNLENSKTFIVADVVGFIKKSPLIIEIFVTHEVDYIKKEKLRELNIPSIQIDFSSFSYNTSKEEIKEILISGKKTQWIYYPFPISLETEIEKYKVVFKETNLTKRHNCQLLKKHENINDLITDCSNCIFNIYINEQNKVICSNPNQFKTKEELDIYLNSEPIKSFIDDLLQNDITENRLPYGDSILKDFQNKYNLGFTSTMQIKDFNYMVKIFRKRELHEFITTIEAKKIEAIMKKYFYS